MIINDAIREDIPTLVKFQLNMALETEDLSLDAGKISKGINAIFDDPAKGRYFVARLNNEITGCLMITYEWSEWRNASIIWIQSVYVAEKYRRQGVYRSLYQHIQKLVQTHDEYQGIRLYVEQNNSRAQEVYRSLGMTDEHYLLFEWMDDSN